MKVIVAIYDKVAQNYNVIGVYINAAIKVRELRESLNLESNRGNSYVVNGSDYELYTLGEMDEQTGKITCYAQPTLICRFNDLIL